MGCSLVTYAFSGAMSEATLAGCQIAAGAVDAGFLTPAIGGSVIAGVVRGHIPSPEKLADNAQSLCNTARWAEHKTEQIYYDANRLNKRECFYISGDQWKSSFLQP